MQFKQKELILFVVAESWEIERAPGFIPLTDLRSESVVKKLIDENRRPILARSESDQTDEEPAVVTLFIAPSQKQRVSIADAKEISTILNKLRREI